MISPLENNKDYFLIEVHEPHCKDIVTKSLRGLYNKNAIDIENDTIFLKLGDENFKREFNYNEHILIDGKEIMIQEYNGEKIYVKLYYWSKENKVNDAIIVDFRTRISNGGTFFGEIHFKLLDCVWFVNDIYMISKIE